MLGAVQTGGAFDTVAGVPATWLTMEQLSDVSRQVSDTAAQIAGASAALATLAANLDRTAGTSAGSNHGA